MKTINMQDSNEKIYYEKLENGLEVYLYPKDKFHNNYVTFTTKFGSINNEFIPIDEDEMIKVPNGIAHFLEHKVFVQENDPQPTEFFSESGTMCNAYTTFKNTTYLFSGANNLIENINYLLDYVQSPYFTDENVESEKGIIIEEINMCNDRPTDILYEEIRRNAFLNNNFKESIIGTEEDINGINKDLLYTCYNTFYHPSNMVLVVTGNFDKEKVLETIRENQSKKDFKPLKGLKQKQIKESDKIVKKESIININTDIPKVAYNIKIPFNKNIEKRKYSLYLFIIFSCLFDDTSEFDERLKKESIITNTIYFNLLNCDTHILVSLINETYKYKELFEKIKNNLKNICIDEKDFERKKKVLISNEIFIYDNIEIVNEMIIDNILFENKLKDNIIPLIKELDYDELNDVIKSLNLSNNTTVILKNDNNNKKNL